MENAFDGKTDAYVAVNIVMPSDLTRATDGGTVNGSDSENKVSSLYCLFYDTNGNFLVSSDVNTITNNPATEGGTTTNIENTTNAVLVLQNLQTAPKYMITIVNAQPSDLEGKKMGSVRETIWNASTAYATSNQFVMSTSAYYGSENVYWTDISSAVKENKNEAIAAPIDVYVERLAAKVSATTSADFVAHITNEGNTLAVNGTDATWEFTNVTWGVSGTNKTAYLIKNFDESWGTSDPFTNWNASTSYRSYWAKDPNYTDGNFYANYQAYNTGSGATNGSLVHKKFTDITNTLDVTTESEYCLENTLASLNNNNATHILICGQWEQNSSGTSKAEDLFFYAGAYYTTTGYINLILNAISNGGTVKYYSDNAHTLEVSAANFQIQPIANEANIVQITPDGAIYDNAGTNVSSTVAGALSNENYRAEAFKGGRCYYAVNIEHLANSGVGHIGIVRNHVYDITINGIKKMGVGVWDPNQEIIPEEKTLYYVAAKVNVLSWKKVSQSVTLE